MNAGEKLDIANRMIDIAVEIASVRFHVLDDSTLSVYDNSMLNSLIGLLETLSGALVDLMDYDESHDGGFDFGPEPTDFKSTMQTLIPFLQDSKRYLNSNNGLNSTAAAFMHVRCDTHRHQIERHLEQMQ